MTNKKLNFKVAPDVLALAYKGDINALLKIAEQVQSEKRLGLAKNFFRLANESSKEKAVSAA